MRKLRIRWAALIVGNVLFCCVLGFYQSCGAAPGAGRPPFSNPVEQRAEIIRQLQQLNTQLREQNMLLRNGQNQVASDDADT